MPHILIIDGSTMCRELLGKALEARGMSVSYAPTCAAADKYLGSENINVIIVDPAVDQGEGMAWLHALRLNVKTKTIGIIILTDITNKEMVMRAARLGIREYMLKQRFSLPELVGRIQKLMSANMPASHQVQHAAASPVSPAAPALLTPPALATPPAPIQGPGLQKRLTREQTLTRVEECKQAKTLPGVVAEIMGLVNSPRGAISDVAQTLKRDPVLAARVLQMANSAAFVSQKPRVTNLDEATRNIGISGVRSMVMSAGIFELFSAEGPEALNLLRFWQHSFAVAAVMERLAPASDTVPAGSAHLVGLCHDLADLALAEQFPDEYAAAVELSRQSAESIFQSRSRVFGMPYHELVNVILKKLGLPATIISPITEVVERGSRKGSSELRSELARALRMANVYANGLMLPNGADAPITPITITEFREARKNGEVPELDEAMLRSEALTMVNVLSGASGRLISQISVQPVEESATRVWYARHAVYCGFDPLAAFFRLVADVVVHDKPPATAADLDTCDIVCVADPRQENPLPAQQQIGNLIRVIGGASIPILYFSGVAPQLLSAPPHGKCEKLPVQLPALIDVFNSCVAGISMAVAA